MANLTQTPANVGLTSQAGSSVSTVKAGETITQGQPIYLLNGKYYRCDASTKAAAEAKGIAMTAANADEYVVVAYNGSTVDLGATMTVGETYCVSATDGAIAPISDLTTGDFPTILGTATAADTLPLNIIPGTVAKP